MNHNKEAKSLTFRRGSEVSQVKPLTPIIDPFKGTLIDPFKDTLIDPFKGTLI